MRALILGAAVVAFAVGWAIKHTLRDWEDWRGSVDRMKGNRSAFFGSLPRALIAVGVGLAVLRTLF